MSDLIGHSVWDAGGQWVGHVVDVRLKARERFGMKKDFQVIGLIVSAVQTPGGLLSRRGEIRTDGFLGVLARILDRTRCYVPMHAVSSSDTGEVLLNARREDLKNLN
ncbi:hypothetical protein [Rhizohabitans arisaemae]|uniref:hypothetical protein n=1 Tax=Rhizohabitans arisaemae TaxID=2720610 RepID=UPI0024B114E7|nr:hypothetical protein [Rhizohabitans arisaemae]